MTNSHCKYSGREPLTAKDVAEIVVFAASRRQNTVVADVLVLPKHQVRLVSGPNCLNMMPTDLQAYGALNSRE
jgi:hypothetical protein